jgi:hypothetical protein
MEFLREKEKINMLKYYHILEKKSPFKASKLFVGKLELSSVLCD